MKNLIVVALLLIGSVSFADEMTQDQNSLTSLYKAFNTLVKSDLSCAKTTDCLAMPIGSRACGGPSAFAVVSKLNRNSEEVAYLGKRLTEREAEFNQKYGLVSICSIEMPPNVSCQAKKCIGQNR